MSGTSRSGTPRCSATVITQSRLADVSILHLEGALHVPLGTELRRRVHMLLRTGERKIVLCLARVATVDAAGVGELVRVHNMAVAANACLRIKNTTANVTTLLDRLGLLDLLGVDVDANGEAPTGTNREA
jgi:anti-anti-sigma factor